jgi:formate hydrogenlyase subunit 6/NADH:ubiquinone oxidoreductase subunit I
MKRGTTRKQSTTEALVLDRKMVTRRHVLELDRIKCVGCELCVAVCPPEAVEFVPGTLVDGMLAQRPTVDIDAGKCHFCGECVVVCPVNALSLTIDGEARVPVWEHEVFPVLTKEIEWDGSELPKDKADAVVAVCPTEVISVDATRTKTGKVRRVKGVHVDESDCIYCKQCEAAAPEAFAVTHPFDGVIRLPHRCPGDGRRHAGSRRSVLPVLRSVLAGLPRAGSPDRAPASDPTCAHQVGSMGLCPGETGLCRARCGGTGA